MRSHLRVAVLLGLLNAAVAVLGMALVELATPDSFGWYAYAPLDDVVVRDPRFPGAYVAVPLLLLAADVVAVCAWSARAARRR